MTNGDNMTSKIKNSNSYFFHSKTFNYHLSVLIVIKGVVQARFEILWLTPIITLFLVVRLLYTVVTKSLTISPTVMMSWTASKFKSNSLKISQEKKRPRSPCSSLFQCLWLIKSRPIVLPIYKRDKNDQIEQKDEIAVNTKTNLKRHKLLNNQR